MQQLIPAQDTLTDYLVTQYYDIANILIYLLENYNSTVPVNIGKTGEITIKDLTSDPYLRPDFRLSLLTIPPSSLIKSHITFH